jgi:hypothetical protein
MDGLSGHGRGFDKGPARQHIPAFPLDLVTYVYEKTKRVEHPTSHMGYGSDSIFRPLGAKPTQPGRRLHHHTKHLYR